MAALDTNVQAGDAFFVPVTVLLELEWVLRSAYRFDKAGVSHALARLLGAFELVFESEGAVEIALAQFERSAADFADCMHAARAAQAKRSPWWTFDKTAPRLDGASLLTA